MSLFSPEKALVDTNILIYAYDRTDAAKHTVATNLLRTLLDAGNLVLSVQVVHEFYSAATRPAKPPSLSHDRAVEILAHFAASCTILPLSSQVSFRALDAIARYRMSLWDALIWAVARENNITLIYTEDTQTASEIEGVRYINPFAP